jgi:hypothetical protein
MDLPQEEETKLEQHFRGRGATKYLSEKYHLPCSEKTLAKLRCIGGGPPFRLVGRFPLYPISGLDEWAKSKIGPLVRSTSEARRAAQSHHTPMKNPAARFLDGDQ